MPILEEISLNLQQGKAPKVKELVAQALEEGISPGDILEKGLLAGMDIISVKFKNNEVFVPEVLIAARAMNMGVEVLKPKLVEAGIESKGTAIIGTVYGDLHDIGKNIVRMMLEGKGIKVIDLGTNVSADAFIQAAIDNDADLICCSALLTTTMNEMKGVVEAAKAKGLDKKLRIMVGGAPITQSFCDAIGADYYTADAASAAEVALEYCLSRKKQ